MCCGLGEIYCHRPAEEHHLLIINQFLEEMSHKHKISKHEQEVRDAAEGRRFMLVLAIAVAVLVLLLYFAVR